MITPAVFNVLLTAFLAQSDPPVEKKCTLEGQVVSAATGGPLKHATLRLSPIGQTNPQGPRTSFSSSTDAEGKFIMQDVDAGTYTLSAQRVGYVNANYGARSANSAGSRLKLDAGASMKDLVIKLVPQAMIFGKAIDEDGEPVPYASIQCQRWRFMNGKKQLVPAGNGQSQADGTFVIGNLSGGRVYLSAEVRTNNFGGEIERASGKAGREGFLKTYFPNTLDVTAASPIEANPGAEIRGIEIHVRRGRLYEVRGHVEPTVAVSLPEYISLFIFPKGGDNIFGPQNQTNASGKKSAFQFKNVLPGTYVIETAWAESSITDPATGDVKSTTRLTGRMEVTVGDTDLENVVVQVGPGIEIAGTVKTEGDPPPASQQSQTTSPVFIYLRPTEGRGYGNTGGRASDQGNFRIHAIPAAVYRADVSGVPEGSYLKSVRYGGEDITGKDLDLTSGAGGEMQIVISSNAADVSGVVRNGNGEAVQGVAIQCYLGDELKRSASTDQNGSYHLTSLAPGDYRIFAWEDIEPGLGQEPSFRKNFENRAAVAKLEEKSHESLELKLISKDDIETEAAKIR